ncbi:dTMP kinase [Cerasicoccus arenae]|uniref:Thymidylate kinase n=1 Tax=Cerasicoccus arenae TaxID=424488 RepID=A0A8J3GCQ7_9BACT|nr:dTMP kinase [Cerasicoccus arenae]MBK1857285.1 dTMP kinase [Cerasicoccus arenae]GHC00463.1 thymidylate kinase [Cerasicoccus arenae]
MSDTGGILISFEGSEGSGKSTQIARLAKHLELAGREVLRTREPGGTALGEQIRHLLKHADAGFGMCPEAELLLFAASRAQLVREVILPALDAGKVILCDRFLDSTTVYQGVARQLSEDPVQAINGFAVGSAMPHLTIVVDVPAEVGMERIQKRASDLPDRMEQENIEFYQRVRQGYLLLADQMPERFFVVDGTLDIDSVGELIWAEINEHFFA